MNDLDYLPQRKFMRTGEWVTLVGMALNVVSASMIWGKQPPKTIEAVAAVYSATISRDLNGFDYKIGVLSVGWIMVVMALVASSLLLWDAYSQHRKIMQRIHIGAGVITALVALIHFGPHPAIWIGIVGGCLITYGGYERYRLS
ncbi:MAG: hypothetical protein ABJA67_18350 [Chthonomonadales bacterium]